MINQLYIFASTSYVVADEWNANFKAINQSNYDCSIAINYAYEQIAFPDSDLTQLFNAVREKPNSFQISGSNIVIAPQCEYYKNLANGQDLNIQIPSGFNSEARIVIKISDNRTLLPFSISYSGNLTLSFDKFYRFNAGTYFIMIYEISGNAIVKLIWTGE